MAEKVDGVEVKLRPRLRRVDIIIHHVGVYPTALTPASARAYGETIIEAADKAEEIAEREFGQEA